MWSLSVCVFLVPPLPLFYTCAATFGKRSWKKLNCFLLFCDSFLPHRMVDLNFSHFYYYMASCHIMKIPPLTMSWLQCLWFWIWVFSRFFKCHCARNCMHMIPYSNSSTSKVPQWPTMLYLLINKQSHLDGSTYVAIQRTSYLMHVISMRT